MTSSLLCPNASLVAPHPVGDFEQPLTPEPGTEKTGVFPVRGTVGDNPVVRSIDSQVKSQLPAGIGQSVSKTTRETGIDVDGKQVVAHRHPLLPFGQRPQQGQTVLAAGQSQGNAVAVLDHAVAVDGLSNQAVQRFVCVDCAGAR